MPDSTKTPWLTSRDILARANISRATLNNYIKMSILPKPEIRKTDSGTRGNRRMGYFPESVLDRIETVKRLKQKGEPMEKIVRMFNSKPDIIEPENEGWHQETSPLKDRHGISGISETINDSHLKLTIENIQSPAYLINYNFEIEWINAEAEKDIFNTSVRSISHLTARNVFKLFLNWEFNQHIQNWQEIIKLHLKVAKFSLPRSRISAIYEGISVKEKEILEKGYDAAIPFPDKNINTTPLRLTTIDSSENYFDVHILFFREGIFFLYIPSDRESCEIKELLTMREKLISEILKRQLPSLVSLCVLMADMQDSLKISSELLPSEYFSLVNDLWKALASTFEKYGGIAGKHVGDGVVYYFIKKPGSNYIINSIQCALEVKEKTRKFSNDIKLRKGWLNDIFLNIGINEGQEYFGTIRSTSNIEFTALGDSINYAGRLSDFARYGSIWTTKNVIVKLSPQEMESVRFGVYRQENDRQVFVENSFMRVVDLLDQTDRNRGKFMDIGNLPITEIVENGSGNPRPDK